MKQTDRCGRAVAVSTTNAHYAMRHADTGSIGQSLGKLTDTMPTGIAFTSFGKFVDVGVEYFLSALGCRYVWKVASTSHYQAVANGSGKRCGHTFFAVHLQRRK